MRSFTDLDTLIGLVPSHVVTRLSAIDFGRGSEALYRDQMPGLLNELADRARVLSITASSAIEGIVVADADRAQRIIDRQTTSLRNRSEQELAGYRDAQDYLNGEDWRPLNAGLMLHLHRLLFAHTAVPGGAFKNEDNLVVDRSPGGSTTVRFKLVPAVSTPFAIDDLIKRYKEAVGAGEHHPVLLSGLFILDFLVIHPFEDGNGRVARLLTGALLGEHGYTVGRYVSLEQAIAESADAYYQALLNSTHGWHEGTTDPWPWLGYFSSLIAGAYAVFADRAAAAQTPGTKQQRVREHILRHAPSTFRLADIRTAMPGVSDQTIRLVLEQLRSEGKVRADGTGRSATWTRMTETASS
ncbi:Fic family protein [Trebonia sp.]|uniref:Fic family protein n=1 Tax=Trebonia sp. TaxID=2767075 RepID=UPI003BB1128C